MNENIIKYFIECLKEEAKENTTLHAIEKDEESNTIFWIDDSGIKDFFFQRGESTNKNNYLLPLTDNIKKHVNNYLANHKFEKLYLAFKYITIEKSNRGKVDLYLKPLYLVEIQIEEVENYLKIQIVDYEPFLNYSILEDYFAAEEVLLLKEDVTSVSLWEHKAAIFESKFNEIENHDSIKEQIIIFYGDIQAQFGSVLYEIEEIRKKHLDKINTTSLKYILSASNNININRKSNYIELFELNREQEEAVFKALNSSFMILTGPPGTGKSQVLLNLLANIWYNGKTVLFASKNNKAVNTVLEKLDGLNSQYPSYIRLGNKIEKQYGKEKLLNGLNVPEINNQEPETNNTIILNDFFEEIKNIYKLYDKCLSEFNNLHLLINKQESILMDIDHQKLNYTSRPEILNILEYVINSNSVEEQDIEAQRILIHKNYIEVDNYLKEYKNAIKIIQNFNDASILKLLFDNPEIINITKYTLHRIKELCQQKIKAKRSFIGYFLYLWVKRKFRKQYLNILKTQAPEITKYIEIGEIKIESYQEALRSFLALNELANYIGQIIKKRNISEKNIADIINTLDELIPGITVLLWEYIILSTHDSEYLADYSQIRELFSILESLLCKIDNYNKISYEVNSLRASLKSYPDVADSEKQIDDFKRQIVKLSINELNKRNYEKISPLKEQLKNKIGSYYEKWKDEELSTLFNNIKSVFGIWVTTNLSTRYNIPLRPAIFDYLIIDEASQNDIASAIPLLFRAKNTIMIGDPNQLFHVTTLKENIVNKIAEKCQLNPDDLIYYHYTRNSIYTLGEKRFLDMNPGKKPLQLRMHYRSFKDIIGFANILISEYQLFPKRYKNGPVHEAEIPLGIHWVDVPGLCVNRTNLEEANAIVDYLDKRKNLLSNISVGIITPFNYQARLLTQKLREAGLENIDINKNILSSTVHKFQGDERDVILYSPVISNQILPKTLDWANKQVNLLNVAVTRARSSLIVFGNAEYCAEHDGLHKELFNYTESIKHYNSKRGNPSFENDPSGTEQIFYNALSENGFDFEYQVPVLNGEYILDFLLKANDHFVNIELDGQQHLRTESQDDVRDKEVKKLGYNVYRFKNEYVKSNINEIINLLKKICKYCDIDN